MTRPPLRPVRPPRRLLTVAALAAAGAGVATPVANAAVPTAKLQVAGVPKRIGRNQPFTITVSGTVPENLLVDGGSVVLRAVERTHSPEGTCDVGEQQLLGKDVTSPTFEFHKRVRIRSDLDFHDKPSYRYRVCALFFANRLQANQRETEASVRDDRAATTRVQGRRVKLPRKAASLLAPFPSFGPAGD